MAYAQNSVLAGKIVDENGTVVAGADVKISADGAVISQCRSDKDGLYCSKLLPCGKYEVDLWLNGRDRGVKMVKLDSDAGVKKFYIIKILAKKISLDYVDNDPAMAVKLRKIEKEQENIDLPINGGSFFLRKKDTGMFHSPEKAPEMK